MLTDFSSELEPYSTASAKGSPTILPATPVLTTPDVQTTSHGQFSTTPQGGKKVLLIFPENLTSPPSFFVPQTWCI